MHATQSVLISVRVMNSKVFVLSFAIALCLLPSFQAQVLEESKDEVALMVKNAINMLQEQMKVLEEQLGLKLQSLHSLTETLLNGQNEILPKVEKCSAFYEFTANHNECSSGSHRCSEFAQCIDGPISYKCQCIEGYTGDGFRCYDIDECLAKNNPCHELAECSNTPGSYNCTCPEYYSGDGHNCHIVCDSYDEEITKPLGCLKYIGEPLTWAESRRQCRRLGTRLAEGFSNMSLIDEFHERLKPKKAMWIGARRRKWKSTGMEIASDLYANTEPDGDIDSCILMNWRGLSDEDCSHRYHALCQSD